LQGHSTTRPSLIDRHIRATIFHALVEGVSGYLAQPDGPRNPHARDEVRWWNGLEWTYEPPRLSPGWQPDPTGHHELRYWDGELWTGNVLDSGRPAIDEL
jgi:hypothetical protein